MTTATDLATMTRCPHRIHLDATRDTDLVAPANAFLQLLWEGGRAHEDDVISGLQVERVSRALHPGERQSETRLLMQQGVPLIYHGYLEHGELVGEPDLLERVDAPSALGPFSYLPVDIKSGMAFEGKRKTAKRQYLMQLCAYAELLEAHQGLRPGVGKIIDGNSEWQSLDLDEAWPEYLHLQARIDRILAGMETTRPGLATDCGFCPWREECLDALITTDDLTTVAGVGPAAREGLELAGVSTVQDLAQSTPDLLITVKGIGDSKANAWPRQAAVQKSGVPLLLEPWHPPDVDFEVSYDIEDFTPDPFVYLHGLLIRQGSAVKYGGPGFSDKDWGSFEPLFAGPTESEQDLWQRFLGKIAEFEERGEYFVYVYSSHEKTTLGHLAKKYGGSTEVEVFIKRFVDLMPVAKGSVVFPTERYGLKDLARFVGFEWRDEDPGGAQSMAWWAEYQADPPANTFLRDRILRYNEDDVRATFALRDWIEKFTSEPGS